MKNLLRHPLGPLRTVAMLRKYVPDWSGMASRNGGRPLIETFILMVRFVVGKLTHHRVACVAMYAFRVGRMVSSQGPKGACLYLKACHVLLMQSMAGMILHGTWELSCNVSRTTSGLPRLIDPESRILLRGGDTLTLKLWLTLFSFYRVLEFPGKLKVSTITDPGVEISSWLPKIATFIPTFFFHMPGFQAVEARWAEVRSVSFFNAIGTIFGTTLKAIPFLITKASPIRLALRVAKGDVQMHSSSWPVLAITSVRWLKDPLWSVFESWCSLTGNYALPLFVDVTSQMVHPYKDVRKSSPSDGAAALAEEGGPLTYGPQNLGRLSLKKEPAGKVRVFALVDAFTQWLLKPLHDLLFDTLRRIPQDGTFDQAAPLKALLFKATSEGCNEVASLDLSAATDRLPLAVQKLVLNFLIGETLTNYWARLLVDRDYFLLNKPLRYAVGQPMGALSSWAMLAITHHLIVQWAWYRVCLKREILYTWFTGYAVLGDDVVILYNDVIDEYRLIMKQLGVGISLAKSVTGSRLGVEFAKRYFIGETDCSAVSFAELAVARRSAAAALELGRRHHSEDRGVFLRILGVGPFAITRLENPISKRVAAWQFLFAFPWDDPSRMSSSNRGNFLFFPSKPGKWMESQVLPGAQRHSFVHVLAFNLASQLVSSYEGLVKAVANAKRTRVMDLQDRWSPLNMGLENLVDAASNLDDTYSMAFYPSGEINQAVRALTELAPLLEGFLANAQIIGLWSWETLLLEYMVIRNKLDSVRVPVHSDIRQDTPELAPEMIASVLKMFLVFKLTLRDYKRQPIIYGLRQYPKSAQMQAYSAASIWNSI